MTPHDPHQPHERFRVVDAEPIDGGASPPRTSAGFKVGVAVGLLCGIWIWFLLRVAWWSLS